MNVYILLDRSSSMASRIYGAVKTLNEYAANLPKGTKVTLATFRQQVRGSWLGGELAPDFEIIRDRVLSSNWEPVPITEVTPDGNTPLFDAVGKITDKISKDKSEKGVLMILTDGAENASKVVNADGSRVRLDAVRARGWDVIQVGVEYDNYQQAASMGTQSMNTVSTHTANLNDGSAAAALGHHTTTYYSVGSRGLTDEMKRAMGDRK